MVAGKLPALRNQTDGDSAAQNKCPLWAKSGLAMIFAKQKDRCTAVSPKSDEEWEQPYFLPDLRQRRLI